MKKYTLEFPIKSSVKILYEFISTPEAFSLWFSEKVTIKDGVITFKWYDSELKATVMNKKENEWVRYQWLEQHEHNNQYLELRINIEPVTNDLALIISDYCKPEEAEEQKELWAISVHNLVKRIGGQ